MRSSLTRLLTDQLIGLPLPTEIPGVAWMAITEADLDQYAGMFITNPSAESSNTTLAVRLSPSLDDPGIAVTGFLPHNSPWRVLMIADHFGRLIESNIILNLNPPCALADTSWIKPGKFTWGWWSQGFASGAARTIGREPAKGTFLTS
jgi:alpha-glucosidase